MNDDPMGEITRERKARMTSEPITDVNGNEIAGFIKIKIDEGHL